MTTRRRDSSYDVATSYDVGMDNESDAVEVLTVPEYAEHIGRSVRVVQRYLADNEIPGAEKDSRGRWTIPRDAVRQEPSTDVATVAGPTINQILSQWATTEDASLLTLEAAAAKFGTTEGGIRRMSDAGILTVGRFGPNGALRAYLPRDAR